MTGMIQLTFSYGEYPFALTIVCILLVEYLSSCPKNRTSLAEDRQR